MERKSSSPVDSVHPDQLVELRMPLLPMGTPSQHVFDVRISFPTEYRSRCNIEMPFLVTGVNNPAFDPLELLKAGDVEANPGPARRTDNSKHQPKVTPVMVARRPWPEQGLNAQQVDAQL